MKPKFRAYGRKDYRMSTEIEPKEMYYDVSVVTTFDDKKQHVITDFGMWNEEEYNGTELIDYDLMQSTGMFDKNGDEIFEGDVVLRKSCPYHVLGFDKVIGVVVQQKSSLMLGEKVKSGYAYIGFGHPFTRSELLEVIGNIHEHPHLLEGLND